MKTQVVNVHLQEYDVYIGRAGHGQSGYLGNPHPIGYCPICECHHSRLECIEAFKKDFLARIESDPEYRERVKALKGKVLGCFCKQEHANLPCHGDVYKEWLDNPANS